MSHELTLLCVLGGAALAATVAILLDSASYSPESPMSLITDRITALVALVRQLIARDQTSQATIASLQVENAAKDATIAQLRELIARDAAVPEDYQSLDDATADLVSQINSDTAVPTQVIARVLAARDKIDGMEPSAKPTEPTTIPPITGDSAHG